MAAEDIVLTSENVLNTSKSGSYRLTSVSPSSLWAYSVTLSSITPSSTASPPTPPLTASPSMPPSIASPSTPPSSASSFRISRNGLCFGRKASDFFFSFEPSNPGKNSSGVFKVIGDNCVTVFWTETEIESEAVLARLSKSFVLLPFLPMVLRELLSLDLLLLLLSLFLLLIVAFLQAGTDKDGWFAKIDLFSL